MCIEEVQRTGRIQELRVDYLASTDWLAPEIHSHGYLTSLCFYRIRQANIAEGVIAIL